MQKQTSIRPKQEEDANLMRVINEIVRGGATSLTEIAKRLKSKGITTPYGDRNARSVANVLERAQEGRAKTRRP